MLANDIRNYRTMDDYIAHHGILGQKWGVRRYQDKNGRLTAEGKQRYSKVEKVARSRVENMYKNMSESELNKRKELFREHEDKYNKMMNVSVVDDATKENFKKLKDDFNKVSEKLKNVREDDIKTIFKDFDLKDYYVKRDIEAAFADVSDKYIYSPVRSSLKHSSTVDEVYSAIWDEDYISHYGILGQKWGKKNGPPYPLAAGSHSSSEKKAASAAGVKVGKSSGRGSSEGLNITQSGQKEKPGLIGSMIEGAKNAKLNKQRKQALEKAREAKVKKAEEKAAAEAHEAERQKALNSGDYNQIQKYANESSYEELQRAMNKANAMQTLNQKVVENTPVEKDIWDKLDDASKKINTAVNFADKTKDVWNRFATVYNTFSDPDSMLPKIGENWAEEKEKRLKAKEKEAREAEEKARKERVEEITKKLDPKLVMKNQKMFTKDELQAANNRLVTYSQLKEKADAIDKEKADAKAKELADKQKKQAEKAEAKAKKEFEAQQAKERAKNDYIEDVEYKQYNFGDDDSGFKASNPTFKKAVKETYDYFDNDKVWGSTSMSSSKASNKESTKKAQEVTSSIFSYLNSDKKYNAPVTVNNWQAMYQSSIYDYE